MLKMWNFQALKKADLDIFSWIKLCYSVVMYLRPLFSDKKIKLVYSNEPNQTNLSCTVNDGRIGQRTKHV